MVKMKVTLASQAPAMENRIAVLLEQEGFLTEHLNLNGGEMERQSRKTIEALLLICTEQQLPEQTYGFCSRLLREGVPIFCVVAGDGSSRLLEGKDGITFFHYPEFWEEKEVGRFRRELLTNLKSCYRRNEEPVLKQRGESPSRWIVGIGASTGGPKALLTVLQTLSKGCCGILVVQHLTSGFAVKFAEYLDSLCQLRVKVGEPEELICDGTVYLAPDGHQMRICRNHRGFVIKIQEKEKSGGFSPSIGCLFESMADSAGKRAMGVILTGMGRDGADGLLKMRRAGAYTVGQDQETSDIYSMPYEAMRCGGVERQLPLNLIGKEIQTFHEKMNRTWGGTGDGTIDISSR